MKNMLYYFREGKLSISRSRTRTPKKIGKYCLPYLIIIFLCFLQLNCIFCHNFYDMKYILSSLSKAQEMFCMFGWKSTVKVILDWYGIRGTKPNCWNHASFETHFTIFESFLKCCEWLLCFALLTKKPLLGIVLP